MTDTKLEHFTQQVVVCADCLAILYEGPLQQSTTISCPSPDLLIERLVPPFVDEVEVLKAVDEHHRVRHHRQFTKLDNIVIRAEGASKHATERVPEGSQQDTPSL